MAAFLIELLALVLQRGIIYLAGALGASALASEHLSEIEKWSASAALFTLMTAYAMWRRYQGKQVLVTALASPPMSEAAAKALVKDPSVLTPSVTTPKDAIPIPLRPERRRRRRVEPAE